MAAGYDWFQPSDLPKFFHALQKATRPAILVGGQSLTFWVDYFEIPVPKTDTPYLTQDADVLATKHDARIAAQRLLAQAISLPWSLTGGSRFYVTKRFVEWFYAFLRLSPLPLAGEG